MIHRIWPALALLVLALGACQPRAVPNDPIIASVRANDAAAIAAYIANGGDVNLKDREGNPLLYIASGPQGGPEAVAALIAAGARVDTRSAKGRTPLENAVGWCDIQMVQLLPVCRGRSHGTGRMGAPPRWPARNRRRPARQRADDHRHGHQGQGIVVNGSGGLSAPGAGAARCRRAGWRDRGTSRGRRRYRHGAGHDHSLRGAGLRQGRLSACRGRHVAGGDHRHRHGQYPRPQQEGRGDVGCGQAVGGADHAGGAGRRADGPALFRRRSEGGLRRRGAAHGA